MILPSGKVGYRRLDEQPRAHARGCSFLRCQSLQELRYECRCYPSRVQNPRFIVVASQRRAGTHLTIDFLRANLVGGRAHRHLDLELLRARGKSFSPEALLPRRQRGPVILKTHAWHDLDAYFQGNADHMRSILDEAVVMYACRDPRPSLVSLWHYEERHGEGIPVFDTIRGFLDSAHFLDQWAQPRPAASTRPSFYALHANSWLDQDGTHAVRFEDWKNDPAAVIDQLRGVTGLVFNAEFEDARLGGSERSLAGRVAQRVRRLTGQSSAVGVGVTGRKNWEAELAGDDLDLVLKATGEVCARLGFEGRGR